MSNANTNVLQQSILEAVDTIVSRRIKDAAYDKTITGTINSLVGVKNKKSIYKINYGNGFFNATVLNDEETYIKNTPVYIFIPQGDFSKEKIILGRASNINTDLNLNITNAVLNNFSIVGKNNLITETKNIGLRSYHDVNEEKTDPTTLSHRIQVLYNEEDPTSSKGQIKIESLSNLKRYLSEGSAIMLKADFRTDLSLEQKRQATGRYGLIFELLFDNEKLNWGSTQEEILKNVCEKKEIKAKTEFGNGEEEKSFLDYVFNKGKDSSGINTIEDIMNNLNEDNFENYISGEDSQLKRIISELTALYATYVKNSPEKNQEIVQETITSFLKMLQGLVKISTSESVIKEYNSWLKTEPNLEKEKKVYLQLDSNSMVGAPLYFKNWTSQHEIFKIDNLDSFKKINKILFFKTGFIQNKTYDEQKTEDIFVKDIGFYVLKPLDSVSGDYSLKVEAEETGAVVSEKEGKNKAIFKGSFYRKLNDLSQNLKLTYYWFKENPSVVIGGEKFNRYGGVGWELVSDKNENSRYFETEFNENPAAKNSYKCVAVFSENSETEIVIVAPFIVYNSTNGHTIELTSDQGTVFQFSSGTPIITCLIDGEEKNLIEDGDILKFYWSIVLENEEEIPFYSQIDLENLSIDNIENYQFQDQYFNNVKFYKLEEDKPIEIEKDKETGYIDTTIATRLMYPMINLKSDEKIKVKCVVIKNDSVTLGNAELEFENRGGALVDGYHIEFENDNQIFQYDEYGNSPKLNKLDPLEVLPIKAKLISPSGAEFSGSNVQVDWIFNLDNSMIIPLGNLSLNSATGNTDTVRNETLCYFDIKSIYDPNAINNQIMCHINFNDQDYYKETNLFFTKIGENGTNGTDIAVRITPVSDNSILDTQALTLYTFTDDEDKDEEGKAKIKGFLNEKYKKDDDKELSTSVQLTKAEKSGFQVNIYQKGKLLPSDKYQSYWNLAGNPSETMISKGKNFCLTKESETNVYYLSWDSTKNNPYQLQIIKSHIKFSDKITTKDDDGNEIETETNKKEFYGYYPLPIIYFKNKKDIATYANNRLAIDKNSYLKEVTYNADGRNPIYNHNQGLKIINIPENSRLIIMAKGGWNDEEDDPDFLLLQQELDELSGQIIQEFVKKITIEDSNNFDMIYILPNDTCSGSKTNNRIEVKIQTKGTNNEYIDYATLYVPIIFILNTFGLASLNAWDGNSVTIDEEGGYIMAPQIGAGEKDDNNRFTGIVMGKTEIHTGGSEKEKQIGLFGYKDGLQSIFLDAETGDAIFGLPDVEERDEERDEEGNPKKFYKKTNREAEDNYQEGRIELRPGGTSIIGGWRIGRKSLYYTGTGALGGKNGENPHDYVPDIKTGVIKEDSNNLYGGHHDKDIKHEDSGILLSGGKNPYVSIKSEPFVKDNISDDSDRLLEIGDSLELQLDPNTPTLFTIFRHNGENHQNKDDTFYASNSRTFLAGINNRGEFIANSIGNKNTVYLNEEEDLIGKNIASKFYFSSLSAFDDPISRPKYIGFQMTASNRNLGQLFMSLNDIQKEDGISTLYISGGNEPNRENTNYQWGEYLRRLSLHGREIALFVPEKNSPNVRNAKETRANIILNQEKGQIQLSEDNHFLLSNVEKNPSYLKTTEDLNLIIGKKNEEQYSEETISINENNYPINDFQDARYYKLVYDKNKEDGSFYLQTKFETDSQYVEEGFYYKDKDNKIEAENLYYKYEKTDNNNNNNNENLYISATDYDISFYEYNYSQISSQESTTENIKDYIKESFLKESVYGKNENQYYQYKINNIEELKQLNNYYFGVRKKEDSKYYKENEDNIWYIDSEYLDLKTVKNDKYEELENENGKKSNYYQWTNSDGQKEYVESFNFSDTNWYRKKSNNYYQLIDDNAYYQIDTTTTDFIPENISSINEPPSYILKNIFDSLTNNSFYEYSLSYNVSLKNEETKIEDLLKDGYSLVEADEDYPYGGIKEELTEAPTIIGFDATDNNSYPILTIDFNDVDDYRLKYEEYLNGNVEDYIKIEFNYNWTETTQEDKYILYNNFYFKYNSVKLDDIYYCDSSKINYAKDGFEELEYYKNGDVFIEKEKFTKKINSDEPLEFVYIKDIENETQYYILLETFEKENYYSITDQDLIKSIGLNKIYFKEIDITQKFSYNFEMQNYFPDNNDGQYYQTVFSINLLFNNFYPLESLNLEDIYICYKEDDKDIYIKKQLINSQSLYYKINDNYELLTDLNQYKNVADTSVNPAEWHLISKEQWNSKKEYVLYNDGYYYPLENHTTQTLISATFPNKNLILESQTLKFSIGQQINSTKYMLNLDIGEKNKQSIPSIYIKNDKMPIDINSYSNHFNFKIFNGSKQNGWIAVNPEEKGAKKGTESILGMFCATDNADSSNILKNGLIITKSTGYLNHIANLNLATAKTIFIKANETGTGTYYGIQTKTENGKTTVIKFVPQILLQAGDTGKVSRLIMCSSSSGWSNVLPSEPGTISYPLIAMSGTDLKTSVGLYPIEKNDRYEEVFWVNAKQYNANILKLQKGIGSLTFPTYRSRTNLEDIIDDIYSAIKTIKDEALTLQAVKDWVNGRGFITTSIANQNYAPANHNHDSRYAAKSHRHSIRYNTLSLNNKYVITSFNYNDSGRLGYTQPSS